MQFTVLGCHSPFPAPDGATPGYLLTTKAGKHVLLDCGSGVLAQLIKYWPPYELDIVILSHLHHDHIADFFVLQYAIMTAMKQGWRTKPLVVYAPAKPADWVQKLHYHSYIEVRELNEETRIEVDDYTEICSYPTVHSVPCYALQIKDRKHTILYGADSGSATNWEQMKTNPDLFICEATYMHVDLPPNMKDHLSALQAGEIAKSIATKHLLLTHLYPYYDRIQLQKEASMHYQGEVSLCQTGLQIRL